MNSFLTILHSSICLAHRIWKSMNDLAKRLEACREANKDCTLLYSTNNELTGYVKSVQNGEVIIEQLGKKGDIEIALDDIEEITYPLMEEIAKGVFKIIRGGNAC